MLLFMFVNLKVQKLAKNNCSRIWKERSISVLSPSLFLLINYPLFKKFVNILGKWFLFKIKKLFVSCKIFWSSIHFLEWPPLSVFNFHYLILLETLYVNVSWPSYIVKIKNLFSFILINKCNHLMLLLHFLQE